MRKVIYSTLFLLTIAVISAFTLYFVNDFTSKKITDNREQKVLEILKSRMSGFDRVEMHNNTNLIYSGDRLIGYAVESYEQGYSSEIHVLVILDRDKEIKEVIVTESAESPGIGSKVTEQGFLSSFQNKTFADITSKEKGVDAITGATISSTAVIDAVVRAGENYNER